MIPTKALMKKVAAVVFWVSAAGAVIYIILLFGFSTAANQDTYALGLGVWLAPLMLASCTLFLAEIAESVKAK